MAVGDVCTFTIVADDKGRDAAALAARGGAGEAPAEERGGERRQLDAEAPRRITGGGPAAQRDDRVTSADLGWHLTSCRALVLPTPRAQPGDVVRPDGSFIDKSFRPPGRARERLERPEPPPEAGRAAAAQMLKVLTPITAIQAEPESLPDVITRYCQRETVLINVSVDGYIQL